MLLRNPRFHRVLFYLESFIWLLVGVLYLVRYGTRADFLLPAILAAGMVAFAVWFAVVGFFLGRRSKPAYFLAILTAFAAALVGLFDDFGFVDLLFFVFTVLILVILILSRRVYLSRTV